jgi:hypothetical protein
MVKMLTRKVYRYRISIKGESKRYIIGGNNSVRMKNPKYIEIINRSTEDFHNICHKLSSIVAEIENVGQNYGLTFYYTRPNMKHGTFVLDDSHGVFYESYRYPRDGFMIVVEYLNHVFGYIAKFYVVQEYKKQLIIFITRESIIEHLYDVNRIINIKVGDGMAPVINNCLTILINTVLGDIGEDATDSMSMLVDVYSEIAQLIEQVNTDPVNVKSARNY